MKMAISVVFAICSFSIPRVYADLVVPSERVVQFVDVREEPRSGSTSLAQLRIGRSAKLIESVPFWHHVELDDGQRGFVSKAWTRVVKVLAAKAPEELRIHFFNVGPGTCTLVECPGSNGSAMIIDCGSHWQFQTKTGQTAEQIKEKILPILSNYTTPPTLILSHGDYDHYTYLPTVLSEVQTGHIWQGGTKDSYESKGFPTWLTQQVQGGAVLNQELSVNFHNQAADGPLNGLSCGSANTYILTVNTPGSKNANSLVLMLEYEDFTAIFTGDAEGVTEDRIRQNYPAGLKASVLVGSHHGSSTHRSNSSEWANAVAPKMSVFSSGYQFQHPKCASVARFKPYLSGAPSHPIQCDSTANMTPTQSLRAEYMTERNGTVTVTTNGHSPMRVTCSLTPECNGAINH
jgi:beta-lactamase superfamily II metal-dependent hydrolase